MRKILSIFLVILPLLSVAQFAPPAGQEGTTAMHADSSAFVAWATGCVINPGPMNISNPSAGVAGAGYPAENAIGVPDGTYGVVCLGDGGVATLTFDSPIVNGPGPDLAVFENGFKSGAYYFLEIAFVEVSSDGEHFFRFPAITNVPYDTQLGGFATMDPTLIHNFAGKYEAFYGTPFDLDDIEDNPLLDKNNVTHVRVIDVVGCIQPEYATYDSQGHPVNDPWPTPFASSGFDLDAVGVIHDQAHQPLEDATIAPEDLYYWIGEGDNEVVFIVNWNEPDTALAWGYRFNAESVTVETVMNDIAEADDRFSFVASTGMVNNITFNDGVLNLTLHGDYWMYNVNGGPVNMMNNQTVVDGDYIKWGDESCGFVIDPNLIVYGWTKEVAPVYALAEEAMIDPSEIVYWVGEGSNEVVFAVNWNNPNVCYAWGYRFSTDNVIIERMMDDIAAADERFAYRGESGMVNQITFDEGEMHLALSGRYWMYNINGSMAWYGYDEQAVYDGDFVKFGDESCGTYIAPWTQVWETPVQPVSDYTSIDENTINLSLYPNPAHHTLSVQAENVDSMTICSLTGQQLLVSEGSSIDISMLPNGIYLVCVVADGKTVVSKFVKN